MPIKNVTIDLKQTCTHTNTHRKTHTERLTQSGRLASSSRTLLQHTLTQIHILKYTILILWQVD